MVRLLLVTLSSAALLAACASEKPYIPESNVSGTLGGRTAASYPLVSQGNSEGNLRVASYGIADIDRDGEERKAIHLKLAVANSGAEAMVLDVREQRIQLPDGRKVAPAYATSSGRAITPVVSVSARSTRTFDLYFPLPQDQLDAPQPPRFDVVWSIRVDGKPVSEITPFDAVKVDPAVARQQAAEDVMYGPDGYWYDPIWGPAVIGSPAWAW